MTRRNAQATNFEGHGYSFQEILIGGCLGGHEAVVRYLKLRSSHFHRLARSESLEPTASSQARTMHMALHEALSVVESVMPNLKSAAAEASASRPTSASAK